MYRSACLVDDTNAKLKCEGGRPRGFDREAAIATAMELFWRHGYEGVSINDLTHTIAIAPPSLYAAFGSKACLSGEALDRYAAAALDLSVLDDARPARRRRGNPRGGGRLGSRQRAGVPPRGGLL